MVRQFPPSPFFLLLLLLALSAACQRAGDASWQRIQQTGVLSIGLDPTYPPFETLDGDTVIGIDPDLGRALAADLGLQTSFAYFSYDGLYDALATKQVDLLISALAIRPELTRDFAYSAPYFDAGQVLIVPASGDGATMAEMGGRRIAVELGAEGHVVATQWQRRLASLTVLPYDTASAALEAVQSGDAEAAIVDAISARLFTAAAPALVFGDYLTEEPFAVVFRIEDEQLQDAVAASLQRLQQSGQLDALLARWFAAAPGG
jgi:ABC-type amino acid transport substrate-binding protein